MTKAEQQVIKEARQELARHYIRRCAGMTKTVAAAFRVFRIVDQCPTLTIATPYAWGVMWRQA